MSKIKSKIKTPARTVAPMPKLLKFPRCQNQNGPSCSILTPYIALSNVESFVGEEVCDARYQLELLECEMVYFAPRAAAWMRAEMEVLDRIDPFNPDAPGDEEDWNTWCNRSVEILGEKAIHEATLQRLAFWRRASLFGVAADEITPARVTELWELAREANDNYTSSDWDGLTPQILVDGLDEVETA